MPKSKSSKLEWQFAQSFGTDGFCEDDVFAAVEFDATGDKIALGDQAGRITVFEVAGGSGPKSTTDTTGAESSNLIEYEFYTEFQSHERDFDRLHSVEIEESINCIRWYQGSAHGNFLLSANDQVVKFWKVSSRPLRLTEEERIEAEAAAGGGAVRGGGGAGRGPSQGAGGGGALRLPPRTRKEDWVPQATCKREFKHTSDNTHIETVSMCSDGETFLSADPLNINLWHLEHSNQCFNAVNIKPENLEELTEVITCATFHPRKCSLLAYGTSDGTVRLGDLREAALVTKYAKTFAPKSAGKEFSEITQSLSDVRFTPNGRLLITRDYLTTKVWDVRMEKKPLLSLHVHDYLEEYLGALHQNDCIFDKFDCCVSPDGERVVTGSYDSNFVTHSISSAARGGSSSSSSSSKSSLSETIHATSAPSRKKSKPFSFSRSKEKDRRARVAKMDFAKKVLHTAWHPRMDAVAVASLNKVYIYQASPG